MPELGRSVDAVVFAMGAELRPQAAKAAAALRAAGVAVDLVLEDKKTKWVFKHADRLQAGHGDGARHGQGLATGELLDGLAAWADEKDICSGPSLPLASRGLVHRVAAAPHRLQQRVYAAHLATGLHEYEPGELSAPAWRAR